MRNPACIEILEPRIAPATAVFTWDGEGYDGRWTNPANWAGDVAPGPGSALVFPNAPSTILNDFPSGTVFDSIVLTKQDDRYYHLSVIGNQVELLNGLQAPGEYTTVSIDIRLGADQTFAMSYRHAFHGRGSFEGTLDLNGHTLRVDSIAADKKDAVYLDGSIVDASATAVGTIVYSGGASLHIASHADSFRLVGKSGQITLGTNPGAHVTIDGATLLGFARVAELSSSKGIVHGGFPAQVDGILKLGVQSALAATLTPSDESGTPTQAIFKVVGAVTLNQPSLHLFVMNQLRYGTEMVIIENDGDDPVVGHFAGLPEGALFNRLEFLSRPHGASPSSPLFRITYAGGDGNDVAVIAATPPPALSSDGTVATYLDVDGDIVTIKLEGVRLSPDRIVLSAPNELGGQNLIWLKLPENTFFRNQTLSITAEQRGDGDGHVNVGKIDGYNFARLVIDGDLAGVSAHRVDSLSVESLGVNGGRSLSDQPYRSDVSIFRLREAHVQSDVATRLSISRVDRFLVDGSLTGSLTVDSAGAIRIHGDVRGTEEPRSGVIDLSYYAFARPTSIHSIKIDGSLIGGSGMDSGAILATRPGDPYRSYIGEGSISKIEIGGSLFGAKGDHAGWGGSIRAAGHIHRIQIHGSIAGTESHPVTIGADGSTDYGAAIGRIYVDGDVRYAHFAAGHAFGSAPGHPFQYYINASIKGIVVNGNWIASSAIAGAKPGEDHLFGTRDDKHVHDDYFDDEIATIGALIVYGQAYGTDKRADSFGVVAQQIGFVHIGGQTFAMNNSPESKEDFIYVDTGESGPNGARSDFAIREVH